MKTARPTLVTDPPELARELLKFIYTCCSAEKIQREHTLDDRGVCPSCHGHGCTLFRAANVVIDRGGSLLDIHLHAVLDDVNEHGFRPAG